MVKEYIIKEYRPNKEPVVYKTTDKGLYDYVNKMVDAINIAIEGMSYATKNASDRCQKEDNKKEVNELVAYMKKMQDCFK